MNPLSTWEVNQIIIFSSFPSGDVQKPRSMYVSRAISETRYYDIYHEVVFDLSKLCIWWGTMDLKKRTTRCLLVIAPNFLSLGWWFQPNSTKTCSSVLDHFFSCFCSKNFKKHLKPPPSQNPVVILLPTQTMHSDKI